MKLQAYFDESGDDGGFPILSVGGYVLKRSHVSRLEAQWGFQLRKLNLPYFHMVECAHEPPGGVFKGIDKPTRAQLQAKLISIIHECVEFGVVVATPLRFFDSVRDAYTECVTGTIFAIASLLQNKKIDLSRVEVQMHYESGHKHSGPARKHYLSLRQPFKASTFQYVRKAESCSVQAADLLVWHYNKFVKDKVEGRRRTRKDFRELMNVPTWFLNVCPMGDVVPIVEFHNNSLDSIWDEDNIRALYSPDKDRGEILEWLRSRNSLALRN